MAIPLGSTYTNAFTALQNVTQNSVNFVTRLITTISALAAVVAGLGTAALRNVNAANGVAGLNAQGLIDSSLLATIPGSKLEEDFRTSIQNVQSNWTATTGPTSILNKPAIRRTLTLTQFPNVLYVLRIVWSRGTPSVERIYGNIDRPGSGAPNATLTDLGLGNVRVRFSGNFTYQPEVVAHAEDATRLYTTRVSGITQNTFTVQCVQLHGGSGDFVDSDPGAVICFVSGSINLPV